MIIYHLKNRLSHCFQCFTVYIVHCIVLCVPVGTETIVRLGIGINDVDAGNVASQNHILMVVCNGTTFRIDKKLTVS